MEKLKKVGLWFIQTMWGRLLIAMGVLIGSAISYGNGANDTAMYLMILSFGTMILYILFGFGMGMYNAWKDKKK